MELPGQGTHSLYQMVLDANLYRHLIFNVFKFHSLWIFLHIFFFHTCESIFETKKFDTRPPRPELPGHFGSTNITIYFEATIQ